jgi:hypothetical protein
MLAFTLQTVNSRNSVVHAFTVPAAHPAEARATAQHWATSLDEGGPQGKDWSGLESGGSGRLRCRLSIPIGGSSGATPTDASRYCGLTPCKAPHRSRG